MQCERHSLLSQKESCTVQTYSSAQTRLQLPIGFSSEMKQTFPIKLFSSYNKLSLLKILPPEHSDAKTALLASKYLIQQALGLFLLHSSPHCTMFIRQVTSGRLDSES